MVPQTTESWRLEVHMPLPCFRHDSVTTWSWAVFFLKSFTSLFSDFDFKKAVGCVFNGLFFDRRFAVVSWFGGLLNSG